VRDTAIPTEKYMNMNTLKESFSLNGLQYTLLKRNEVVALYGLAGTHIDEILHYEVDVIYIRNDKYGIREAIADNENFGRDRGQCFIRKDLANKYFEKLTSDLRNERNQSQGVVKVITGVVENAEVMLEPQVV
jgi:hypothetical protein